MKIETIKLLIIIDNILFYLVFNLVSITYSQNTDDEIYGGKECHFYLVMTYLKLNINVVEILYQQEIQQVHLIKGNWLR